ncbi:hypothetical protein [Nocardioides cavernaquae]|uniref:Uncharacterized protein n=1 Tax=Nocardioides cavernaquae TaxID=2321396 RepID=A0A3A5HCH1_9ACTN|nr:hypothetical protein [Nocardioides cavernaquae]RJS47982.1 hypothetical protein D4739_14865 [Nocardioides cavernaquae]
MIPTMLLLGLALGKWPWIALAVAVSIWPLMLVASDAATFADGETLVGGAALAVVNAAIGVLVHQAFLRTWRRARHAHVGHVRA